LRPRDAAMQQLGVSAGDAVCDTLIGLIGPNAETAKQRETIFNFVRKLITEKLHKKFPGISVKVFRFGSVPLVTYLPDGDVDVGFITSGENGETHDSALDAVCDRLRQLEQKHNSEFQVRNTVLINAELRILKCVVQGVPVDISANHVGGACSFAFLDYIDRVIGSNHLFKRTILLVKCWCAYESHTLGSGSGLMATYAVECMILCVFFLFGHELRSPLDAFRRFLRFFADFEWDSKAVTCCGPIPQIELEEAGGDLVERRAAAAFESDNPEHTRLREAIFNFQAEFASQAAQGQRLFPLRSVNIVDPLCNSNNLGRSVSLASRYRIPAAFDLGISMLNLHLGQCSALGFATAAELDRAHQRVLLASFKNTARLFWNYRRMPRPQVLVQTHVEASLAAMVSTVVMAIYQAAVARLSKDPVGSAEIPPALRAPLLLAEEVECPGQLAIPEAASSRSTCSTASTASRHWHKLGSPMSEFPPRSDFGYLSSNVEELETLVELVSRSAGEGSLDRRLRLLKPLWQKSNRGSCSLPHAPEYTYSIMAMGVSVSPGKGVAASQTSKSKGKGDESSSSATTRKAWQANGDTATGDCSFSANSSPPGLPNGSEGFNGKAKGTVGKGKGGYTKGKSAWPPYPTWNRAGSWKDGQDGKSRSTAESWRSPKDSWLAAKNPQQSWRAAKPAPVVQELSLDDAAFPTLGKVPKSREPVGTKWAEGKRTVPRDATDTDDSHGDLPPEVGTGHEVDEASVSLTADFPALLEGVRVRTTGADWGKSGSVSSSSTPSPADVADEYHSAAPTPPTDPDQYTQPSGRLANKASLSPAPAGVSETDPPTPAPAADTEPGSRTDTSPVLGGSSASPAPAAGAVNGTQPSHSTSGASAKGGRSSQPAAPVVALDDESFPTLGCPPAKSREVPEGRGWAKVAKVGLRK